MTSTNVSQIPVMPMQTMKKSQGANGNEGRDFMQIMSASISGNTAADIKANVGVAAPVKSDTPQVSTDMSRTDSKTPVDKVEMVVKTPGNIKRVDKGQTKEADPAADLTEEEIAEVSEIIMSASVEITEVIATDLELPVEEVTDALEELDIMPVELADPKNLYDLVGEIKDMDRMELLTDASVADIKADLKPIMDELVKSLPIKTEEKLPDLARLVTEIMDEMSNADATGVDLGPDGEVVPVSRPMDGLEIASDEIIITDPEEENQIMNGYVPEDGDDVPMQVRFETPVSRPYITADEDMDAGETEAVNTYNDTADEMVETARTMGDAANAGSKNDGNASGKNPGSEAGFKNHAASFEHAASAVAEHTSAPAQTVSFTETVTEAVTRYTSIDTRDLIEQIVSQVRTTVTESITTMSLELHPATLGKMYVQVSEQDGTINAKLFTENENVKQALETQMSALKEQWEQQGSKVNAIEISVGTREFEEQMESQADWNENQNQGSNASDGTDENAPKNGSSNRNINLSDAEGGIPEDMTEAEALEANMMRDYGNTMSVKA